MNMVKIQNPEKEYPSNMGQIWTDDEETLLLEELNKNIDIETISQTHKRTIGGIQSRRRTIAYKMYLENVSMEEIIEQTKLDHVSIIQIIQKNDSKKMIRKEHLSEMKVEMKVEITEMKNENTEMKNENTEMKNEITEMKNEIKDFKNTIKELVDMMKAVYEFEEA